MTKQKECKHHGLTEFKLEGGSRFRCVLCTNERMRNYSRKLREHLVQEAGGKCQRCGYDKCMTALHFHHRDPSTKLFKVASGTRGLEKQRAEAAKCDLLCANCHAEAHEELRC